MYKILLAGSLLLLLGAGTAIAQQIVNHAGSTSGSLLQIEDGNPLFDEDGIVNGIVIWRGNAVHVVNDYGVSPYTGFPNPVLIIRPGAIVKFAGTFSTNGGITWTPPNGRGIIPSGGGTLGPEENVTIQIDGVTITDIRDDAVGGDTNGDGNASTPDNGRTYIRFSGSPRDLLTNSTVKYVDKIGHIGSMLIANNTFVKFGGIYSASSFPGPTQPIILNASPRILNNQFNLIGNSGAGVDLRGMTPVVENNVFRDTSGIPFAVWIGPAFEFDTRTGRIGPTSGTAIISNNRFFTRSGISLSAYGNDLDSLYSKLPFRAEIHGNTMRGDGVAGQGLVLAFAAEASVTDNNLSNYPIPLSFYFDPQSAAGNRTQCALRINNNRFSLEGVASLSAIGFQNPQYWRQNVYIDMKNNNWGDPTGPLDTTVSDGRSNPRGRGLKVISNTIDYVPFVGAALPPLQDAVHLTVNSPSPSTLLVPNASVTLNTFIDSYNLSSTPTGRIVVLLRDADGFILNQPGTIVNVTSGNHTATIPPIQFTVPRLSNVVVVEAALVPDGNLQAARSNLVAFTVARLPSSVRIGIGLSVYGLIRGNTDTLQLGLTYTLTTSAPTVNGSLRIEFKERAFPSGIERGLTYLPINLVVPPGVNRTINTSYALTLLLRDVITDPGSAKIFVTATLFNDSTRIVGEDQTTLPIIVSGVIYFNYRLDPLDALLRYPGRNHFLVGEQNYEIAPSFSVLTRGVTNWELWPGYDEVLDASGAVVARYLPTSPNPMPVTTGDRRVVVRRRILNPIPPNGRRFRTSIRIFGTSGIVVAVDTIELPILAPAQSQARAVASGASQVAFTPITASLSFTANQTAGAAFAEEFIGQFGGPSAMTSPLENFYWRFIPLLRYWSVYDTLRNGTFTANVTFTYTPADFPSDPNFREDSLVVAGYNPLSRQLEALPSTLNRAARTVTTAYTKFFDTWVVASKSTILTSAPPVAALPTEFSLGQNYPNPFNPTTRLSFVIGHSSFISLKVYDVLGREVRTLLNEELQAGNYERTFDASGLASGVYFYRLESAGKASVKRSILLR